MHEAPAPALDPAARLDLDPSLAEALAQLCRTERLLVACDFDGVLAPIVPRAEEARPLPASVEALAGITRLPRTSTALISGRALHSLRHVAQPPEQTLLMGSHGAEHWFGPTATEAPGVELRGEQSDLLDRTIEELNVVSARHPGTSVELKPAGAVLHTRQAADDVATAAVLAARSVLRPLGVYLHDGKRVLEASLLRVDKGQGLALLRDRTRATAVLFCGDDVTDENGFRALYSGDVGVKVGPGETAASYRIDSPEQVSMMLAAVLELRAAVVSEGETAG